MICKIRLGPAISLSDRLVRRLRERYKGKIQICGCIEANKNVDILVECPEKHRKRENIVIESIPVNLYFTDK